MPASPHAKMSAREFAAFQKKRRNELWGLLGDLPEPRKPKAKLLDRQEFDAYTLEHLELDLNGIEKVPARLIVPHYREDRAPAMLYIHAHGSGKEEMFNKRGELPSYADEFAHKGIVALTIDSWSFSGRRKYKDDGLRAEMDCFKEMLWRGRTMWGMMLFDEHQALTYLLSRKEVDARRAGAMGLSMGSTQSWWLAALDPRVKLCIELVCLTDYDELMKIDNLRGHGIYYFIPSLLKHFTAHEINELIVPRPHLSLNGKDDLLTPPRGVKRIRDYLAPLYKKFGNETDCQIDLFNCGHREIPEMRKIVLQWLDRLIHFGF